MQINGTRRDKHNGMDMMGWRVHPYCLTLILSFLFWCYFLHIFSSILWIHLSPFDLQFSTAHWFNISFGYQPRRWIKATRNNGNYSKWALIVDVRLMSSHMNMSLNGRMWGWGDECKCSCSLARTDPSYFPSSTPAFHQVHLTSDQAIKWANQTC